MLRNVTQFILFLLVCFFLSSCGDATIPTQDQGQQEDTSQEEEPEEQNPLPEEPDQEEEVVPEPDPAPSVFDASVDSLTIVEKDDLQAVITIENNSVIELSDLPSVFNVTAEVTDSSEVGSVALTLTSCVDSTIDRTEINAPYTLQQESLGIAKSELSLGDCTLSATPFAGPNREGEQGQSINISFELVDTVQTPTPTPTPTPGLNECNDGIDNDGDGLTDWQYDVGCYGPEDSSENAGMRDDENGWTTFDLSSDSRVIYVSSSEGNDNNNGLSPDHAVASITQGAALLEDGKPDFLLLKRGDTWRGEHLGSFKSGRSPTEKMVISTYGDSTERPIVQTNQYFIFDNGQQRNYLAIMGLHIIDYTKEPGDSSFDGQGNGGIGFVSPTDPSSDILLEDLFIQYAKIVIQSAENIEIRRNVIYRSYSTGTCAFDSNGDRIAWGNVSIRPSGMFMGFDTKHVLIEENIWDENGWNPDFPVSVDGACATIYNHNSYVADVSDITIQNDMYLRASSIGLKVSGNNDSTLVDNITIDGNLFVEGEIGISMSGNGTIPDTHSNAVVINNVFSDIGRTMPTTRDFSWGIWISRNNNALYENNLFVNPLDSSNDFAFGLQSEYNRDITIRNNTTYNYNRALSVDKEAAWDNIEFENNTFYSEKFSRALVDHDNDFNNVTYSGNEYYSGSTSGWFDGYDIDGWRSLSGESNATVSNYSPADPTRNLDSYAAFLGIGSTLDDFAREARKQSRFNYRSEYTPQAARDYIKAGFE